MTRTVVIGIGNPDRGDDAVGLEVACRLRGQLSRDVRVLEANGEAGSLLAKLESTDAAYLVDACLSGAAPGTVLRFDASREPLPAARFGISTHGIGLGELLELARTLGSLPPHCFVYAIEAESFRAGAPLSPVVAAAAAALAERICAELSHA
jgi:hydrogenase maturation protease